jgi:formamidopyrimidine-DNA glycosylase
VPELPDIAAYITALEDRIIGQTLTGVSIAKPFVLRTADPPVNALVGRDVRRLRRIGKRIAIGFEGDLWLVIHLMIAGRLQWREPGATPGVNRSTLAVLTFPNGTLVLTEAGAKRRASMHVVRGELSLAWIDPGGIEPLEADFETFRAALSAENRTLKRALTDPRIVSGIGNAYSDEILHAAKLSPIALTQKLDDGQWNRLYDATQATLRLWIDRFRAGAAKAFPTGVTAFRDGMAVHGRYGKPCPVCGTAVQRIRYADNETNYCPTCQTGGTLLADRSLSRLLKSDWPRTLEELEELKRG